MKIDIKRITYVLAGSLISAVSINEFMIPHHLLSGGVGGVALILQYITGFSAGALILIMNIPIFLFGIKTIDKDFIIYSVIGTFSMSVFLILLKDVTIFNRLVVDDIMLASIFGGVAHGLGAGIVFKNRGSMGGSDIIAVVVKRKRSINIGTISFLINLVIVYISSFLFGMKPAMYTLISMYISSRVLDKVQEGFDRKKSVMIITEKEEEVAQAIITTLHRGVTYLYGEGAYTLNQRRILYCIVTTKQIAKVKHIVNIIDPKAFFTINDTSEVMGKGFKSSSI
jgi:uncharacterized membrane-anchored protein YitT (DUF2179 family)